MIKIKCQSQSQVGKWSSEKKRSTNSTAWSWPNCQKRMKTMSQTNSNLSKICSFVPTNFWQFWVTFISQKFIDHFFPLSYPSQHGCTHYKRVGSLCPEPDTYIHHRKKCIIKSYLPRSCTNLSIGDCTLAFALSQDGLYQEC